MSLVQHHGPGSTKRIPGSQSGFRHQRTVLLLVAGFLAASALITAIASEETTIRTLTSRDGVTIKAAVLNVAEGQVTIRREDGKVMTFPLDRLCDEDHFALTAMEFNEFKASVEPPPAPPEPDPVQSEVNRRVYPRTLEELKAECAKIRVASAAQKGFTEEEKAALIELNIYRYLSGVPGTVELNRDYCKVADRASEACARIGELSHDASPEGLKCNLHRGQPNMAESVHGYIEDPGEHNRTHRGHRTWCLHPDLTATGFGRDATKHYHAMWVNDGSPPGRQRRSRRDGVHAWPGEGFIPVNRMKGNGWTLYAPEAVESDKLEVRVFELKSRLDRPVTGSAIPEGATEVPVPYKNVDTGLGCTVVFEPKVKVEAGKIYWVSMKSGRFRVSYCVEFVADKM